MFSPRDTIESIYKAALNPDQWSVAFQEITSGTGAYNVKLNNLSRRPAKNGAYESVVFNLSNGTAHFIRHELDSDPTEFICCIERSSDAYAYSIEIDDPNESVRGVIRDRVLALAEHLDFAIKSNLTLLSNDLCLSWPRALLDDLPEPAFVMGQDGAVIWQNEVAQAWSSRAVFVAVEARQFSFTHPVTQADFKACLKELSTGPSASTQCVRVNLPEKERHGVFVMRAVEASHPYESAWFELFKPELSIAAVLRCNIAKPSVSSATLHKLYNLTGKEIEVAIALVQGEGLAAYAKRTGVTIETVRWHAKKVMHKMECKKQQDVVHTLLYQNALLPIIP